MQRTCNKCNRTVNITHYHRDKTKPQGRSRTCKDCTQVRAVAVRNRFRAAPVASNTTSRPCRHCQRTLDHSHYKLPNSWYCNHCVAVRREQRRLAQPDSQCDTCGAVKSQQRMLKTRSRCLDCEQTLKSQRRQQQYATHVYSDSAAARRKRRYRRDPLYKLKDNIVTSIANAFANRGYSKGTRTHAILGCSYQDFYTHIESQFTVGMSWDNRELWHLDHRVPVSLAENPRELLLLNRWDNFQPLWSAHNQSKSATVDPGDPLYLELLDLRLSKR